MKLNLLNRKVHYWGAFVISLPLLVMICSGIVLQMKKHSTWVQPAERTGSATVPEIGFDRVLEVCKGIRELEVETWADVNRIDVRPARGMLKVWAKNNWEAQIDTRTAAVLQVAYRRSDLIESIHDGSWFHDAAKIWIFLPTGIALLLLWVTGMYLFLLPYIVRRRRGRQRATTK
jgi:uncharacterized iron-regulated membrane protein